MKYGKEFFTKLLCTKQKKAMPLLSSPGASLIGATLRELTTQSMLQLAAMECIAERTDALGSVSLMDLSVEAEAFGAQVRFSNDEIPTITGALIQTASQAEALLIPAVGTARTQIYLDAAQKSSERIADRPVFAGMIGPFSLAGRLQGVTNALINCYRQKQMVQILLEKCTAFLIAYAKAYKSCGLAGIIMAEPLTGLLSPKLAAAFSHPYVKRIIAAVQDDTFSVIYHNCGNNIPVIFDALLDVGARGYHFGNATNMKDLLQRAPQHVFIMGNIDPTAYLSSTTPASIAHATRTLLEECAAYPNFIPSSGCDIPAQSSWENIDEFFAVIADFKNTSSPSNV